jgi:hypothetical protein
MQKCLEDSRNNMDKTLKGRRDRTDEVGIKKNMMCESDFGNL